MSGLKGLAVIAVVALGALFAGGSLIAVLFEVQGFGDPRDSDPRSGYLFLLALGFASSLVVPVLVWRLLLPRSMPGWAFAAVSVAAVVGVVMLLGLSFGAS